MEIKEKCGNFKDMLENVKDLIKRNLVIILIIFVAFLIYIPRIEGIIGSDAFEILWMADALKEGLSQDSTWLINPLSIFGYYPYDALNVWDLYTTQQFNRNFIVFYFPPIYPAHNLPQAPCTL